MNSMEKKIVVARIQVQEDKVNDFLNIVPPLVKATRAESGNLVYALYQSPENPAEFLCYEEYTNEDAFKVHGSSAHFNTFAVQVKPLLAKDLDIQMF